MTYSIPTQGERATKVLREYGHAMRGSWGDIDGRSVRSDLHLIADWVDGVQEMPDLPIARDRVGICREGGGHWDYFCEEDGPCQTRL